MEMKEHKEYCQNCNDFVDFTVKKVNKTIQVKDETLDVEVYECYCVECGNRIFVYEYEKKNDIIVYDAYKKRVGLLTSSEIKEIRRKRNMTQIELARFVGIGDKDITRYESGSVQNKCIDKLLRLVQDDDSYEEMVRVFNGGNIGVWFSFKPNILNAKYIRGIFEEFVNDELWNPYNPYKKIIKEFNNKEGVTNDYGRERREKVPLA